MDLAGLRVERIRQDLEGTRFAIDLLARRHVALLAVAFTVGASATVAGLAGQLSLAPSALVTTCSATGSILQFRALRELSKQWDLARQNAARATDSLMSLGGETRHDG